MADGDTLTGPPFEDPRQGSGAPLMGPDGGVVSHADLFHTGIVVDDLASAKEQLGAAWG